MIMTTKEILDQAAERLQEASPGCRFVLAVIQDEPENKKTAAVAVDMTAREVTNVLTLAFPTREDAVILGTYIGQRIYGHTKQTELPPGH